jgi:hypothetical protein
MGDGYYCDIKNKWVYVLFWEASCFFWENGVYDILDCLEEEHFRESRYLPLFEETFDRALDMDDMGRRQSSTKCLAS